MTNPLKSLGFPTKSGLALLGSLGLAAMMLPFFAPQSAKANNDQHDDSDSGPNSQLLVGTWLVDVANDPSSVPPGGPLNFIRVDTYALGGVLVDSNTGPGAGGPGGQGNWVAVGHRQFAATELRLGFDVNHQFTGINKIRRTLTVNKAGNEFTGNLQVDIYSPEGVLLPIHPFGTYHGVRVPIEPLH